MKAEEIKDIIEKVEAFGENRRSVLASLDIPESTYYSWRGTYKREGISGLKKRSTAPGKVWNRILPEEEEIIIKVSKDHPELTSRLIAVHITDNKGFYVGEKTVYRLLKKYNLIEPRPLKEIPAAKEYKSKTTRSDEMWQCDGTNMFIRGWGYYKYILVIDDYSRYVLTDELKLDETGYSISDAIESAIEEVKRLGHSLKPPPVLLSDNGPGFRGDTLSEYLWVHGIKHRFGRPYHPQTQGKVERFNKTTKSKTVNLIVYSSPDELQKALKKAVWEYNHTPHSSLNNVSPADVYAGRKEEILRKRAELKRLTLEKRKKYNLGTGRNGKK